tara:strand:- start:505 stop:621 length:117 start_codon:yes stop_codon:yes gene_type:complete
MKHMNKKRTPSEEATLLKSAELKVKGSVITADMRARKI